MGEQTNQANRNMSLKRRSTKKNVQIPVGPDQFDMNATEQQSIAQTIGAGNNHVSAIQSVQSAGVLTAEISEDGQASPQRKISENKTDD